MRAGFKMSEEQKKHISEKLKGRFKKRHDPVGKRFERMVVLSRVDGEAGQATDNVLCQCDCGKQKVVKFSNLKNGHTQSCGCRNKEVRRQDPFRRTGKKAATFIDYLGQRIGILTVIELMPDNDKGNYHLWKVRCDCGKEFITSAKQFTLRPVPHTTHGQKFPRIYSCGCQRRATYHPEGWVPYFQKKEKNSPTMISYIEMKTRCNNPKRPNYKYYGGRGITVCPEWNNHNGFEDFHAFMGDRPKGHILDRIDPEGNYEKGNVRWAPRSEAQVNTRRALQRLKDNSST